MCIRDRVGRGQPSARGRRSPRLSPPSPLGHCHSGAGDPGSRGESSCGHEPQDVGPIPPGPNPSANPVGGLWMELLAMRVFRRPVTCIIALAAASTLLGGLVATVPQAWADPNLRDQITACLLYTSPSPRDSA